MSSRWLRIFQESVQSSLLVHAQARAEERVQQDQQNRFSGLALDQLRYAVERPALERLGHWVAWDLRRPAPDPIPSPLEPTLIGAAPFPPGSLVRGPRAPNLEHLEAAMDNSSRPYTMEERRALRAEITEIWRQVCGN